MRPTMGRGCRARGGRDAHDRCAGESRRLLPGSGDAAAAGTPAVDSTGGVDGNVRQSWRVSRSGQRAITGSISGAHLGDQLVIAARGAATSQAAIKWWDGSAWQPRGSQWIGLGQPITAQPAIAWFGSDVHVCARFPDGTPHHLIYSPAAGAITQDWQPIQGGIIGSPTLVAGQDNTLRLVVRGTSRRIFLRTYQMGAWSDDWENLGGQAIDSPTALSLPRTADRGAEFQVFVTGLSRAGLRKVWDGTRGHRRAPGGRTSGATSTPAPGSRTGEGGIPAGTRPGPGCGAVAVGVGHHQHRGGC